MKRKYDGNNCDINLVLEEGMVLVKPCNLEFGEGVVLNDPVLDEYHAVVWKSGKIYTNLFKDTKWVLFKQIGRLTEKELLAFKLSHLDKIDMLL